MRFSDRVGFFTTDRKIVNGPAQEGWWYSTIEEVTDFKTTIISEPAVVERKAKRRRVGGGAGGGGDGGGPAPGRGAGGDGDGDGPVPKVPMAVDPMPPLWAWLLATTTSD